MIQTTNPLPRKARLELPAQPVCPPDYGFAIVDRAGKVLFHSTPAKNGRENFVDACERSRRLRDLIETREGGILETSYLGIRHRVRVQPIKEFVNCPWSMVVFRDLTNWEEDHLDSVLLFCFLAGSYIVFIVIAGWLAGLTNRPPDWIWPAERNRRTYWRIFWVLILVNVFNFWIFSRCDGTELWLTAYAIPLVAVIFTVLKLTSKDRIIPFVAAAVWLIAALWTWYHEASVHDGSFWLAFTGLCAAFACLALPPGRPLWKTAHRSLATVYALPATVLLLTVGLIPALRLFNASVLFQQVVAARRSQLELAGQLERRRERLSLAYFGSDGSEQSVRGRFLPQRLGETKDLYYLDSFPAPKYNLQSHRLEPLLSFISSRVLEHDGSSPLHRLGLSSPDAAREWCADGPFRDQEHGDYSLLMLGIAEPEKRCSGQKGQLAGNYHTSWIASTLPQKVLPGVELSSPWVLLQSVLMWLLIVAAFFALRDAIKRLFALDWNHPEPWPEVEISPGMDLRDPRFGRHAVLLGVPRCGKTEALQHCPGVHYFDLIGNTQLETKHLSAPSDQVVVLDHFEYDLDSAAQWQRKLAVLERLVYQAGCRVVIVTTVDPLYYFDQLAKRKGRAGNKNEDSLDFERWNKVMAGFHVVQATNRSSIGKEQYFALLRQTCSDEEGMALYQIAKHGWVNYLQEPALTHLYRRGLVTHDPKFAVTDPDFPDYIRRSCSEEHFVIPEEGGTADILSALRIVLVVVGVVFISVLAYVWGDQMVAYVATGASAVTAATRAFAKSKGHAQMGAGSVEV